MQKQPSAPPWERTAANPQPPDPAQPLTPR